MSKCQRLQEKIFRVQDSTSSRFVDFRQCHRENDSHGAPSFVENTKARKDDVRGPTKLCSCSLYHLDKLKLTPTTSSSFWK